MFSQIYTNLILHHLIFSFIGTLWFWLNIFLVYIFVFTHDMTLHSILEQLKKCKIGTTRITKIE